MGDSSEQEAPPGILAAETARRGSESRPRRRCPPASLARREVLSSAPATHRGVPLGPRWRRASGDLRCADAVGESGGRKGAPQAAPGGIARHLPFTPDGPRGPGPASVPPPRGASCHGGQSEPREGPRPACGLATPAAATTARSDPRPQRADRAENAAASARSRPRRPRGRFVQRSG